MELYSMILAAGEGKRMKSNHAKPLQMAAGKPLIDWVLGAVTEAGIDQSIVVVGHKAEEIEAYLGEKVIYTYQREQLGTGHAVMQGIEPIRDQSGTVMVLCGDTPLIQAETLQKALAVHCGENRAATVITAVAENPFGYGRIVRENGKMTRIVEQKDASEAEQAIREINAGMYLFDIQKLTAALGKLHNDNAQGEYYLTDVIGILIDSGETVDTYIAEMEETMGVNDRIQLAEAERLLNARMVQKLMLEGACILDPASVRVEAGVKVGRDTVIYPNTILEGTTQIGEECVIGPNTRLQNCVIGDQTQVQYSVALDSRVGSKTSVGPFAYIRPGSVIGNGNKVGDFVEVKNASIGDGTKIAHLTYVGDADVGKRVNFGCGTVVVNYDGISKHRTVIEDDCFIGCNSNLVSPVTVRSGAYTAAGSTITDEVPEDALAIARARQVNKEGWVTKNRRKDS